MQLTYDQSLLVIHFALPAIVQLSLYIYLGWVVSRLTRLGGSASPQNNNSQATATLLVPTTQHHQQSGSTHRSQGRSSPPQAMGSNMAMASVQQQQQNRRPPGSVSVVRRQRAWRTLIALSVLFPISWLPYYILYTYLIHADPAAIGPRTSSLHTLLELFAMLGFSNRLLIFFDSFFFF